MPCTSPTTRTSQSSGIGCRSRSVLCMGIASCGRTSCRGANACISIPTFKCFECGTHNLDGASQRPLGVIGPRSQSATCYLTGQPSNFVSLQPRGDTNCNRSQQARSGRAESSSPAVVKGQATKLLRKATNAGLALEDTLTDNPFTAYNHARFGITISSMEMVAK